MAFQESRSERNVDAVIHGLGVVLGFLGAGMLGLLAIPHVSARGIFSLTFYAFGLVAMLTCSAVYNAARHSSHANLLRRIDHAVIYIMIAGTCSPIAMMAIGGGRGLALFVFVWTVATAGIAVKLLFPGRFERVALAAWLVLGWTALIVVGWLHETIAGPGLALLAAGCVLYSVGVVFHLWTRLPYHNAIWHCFVLAAAACHYVAVVGIAAAGFES